VLLFLTSVAAACTLNRGYGRLCAGHDFSHRFFSSGESIMPSSNQGNQGNKGSSNRGFASMDPQRPREIASEGGRAAQEKGTAHEFTSEEAREAGRKGGQARSESNRAGGSRGSR
jgi:general stress protein YciG